MAQPNALPAPTFHGIKLAGESVVENFGLEVFDTENTKTTTETAVGRMWFENGQLQYTELNDQGGVVSAAVAKDTDLDAEASARSTADNTLQTNIDNEASARSNADSTLQTNIDNEKSRALAAETALQTSIDYIASNTDQASLDSLTEIVSAYQAEDGRLDGAITTLAAERESMLSTAMGAAWTKDEVTGDWSASFSNGATDVTTALNTEISARSAQDDKIEASIGLTAAGDATWSADQGDATSDAAVVAVALSTQTVIGAIEDLNKYMKSGGSDALAAEESARTAADSTLTTNLTTEVNRAKGAEQTLTTNLTQEVSDRKSAVTAEETARSNADTALQDNINSEESARIAQDDKIEASIGLTADGTYAANSSADYINTATSVQNALDILDTAISALDSTSGASAADFAAELLVTQNGAGLNGDGNYEANVTANYISTATSLKDADNKLDTQAKANADAIAAEETARSNADTELWNKLNFESSTRSAADTALQDNIDSEASTRSAADTALQDNIDSEASTRSANDKAIVSEINKMRFSEQTTTATTEHTILHNLNSANIIINVLTEQDTAGVYANDIVPVAITDNNSFKVYLSEARNIRVSVMRMDALTVTV